jgi:hypothetical protein
MLRCGGVPTLDHDPIPDPIPDPDPEAGAGTDSPLSSSLPSCPDMSRHGTHRRWYIRCGWPCAAPSRSGFARPSPCWRA